MYNINNVLLAGKCGNSAQSSEETQVDHEYQRIDENEWTLIQAIAQFKSSQTMDVNCRRFSSNYDSSDEIVSAFMSILGIDKSDEHTITPRLAAKKLDLNLAIH